MRPRAVAAAAAAVAVLAGCGSTVATSDPASSTTQLGMGSASGSSSTATSGVPVGNDGAALQNTAAPGSAGTGPLGAGGSGPTGGGNSVAQGTAGGQGVVAGAAAPGVTNDKVYIGISYAQNAAATSQAMGFGKITYGDPKAEAEALISDINSHGGLAGRRLTPVWHAFDTASTQSMDQQEQAACADYTQDHHVFAALGAGGDSYLSCMSRSAFTIGSADADHPAAAFSRFPSFYDTNTLDLEREMYGWVESLVTANYFTGWNQNSGQPVNAPLKVGIMSSDYGDIPHAVSHVLIPRLAAHGIHVDPANVLELQSATSAQDNGRALASIQNATLKFKTNGVTHVLVMDDNGAVTLYFTKDSQSQRYFPRLGVTSGNFLQSDYEAGYISAQSANGAAGLGWEPLEDLPSDQTGPTGRWSTTSAKRCLAIMNRAGITFDSDNARWIGLAYCDLFFFLQRAFQHVDRQAVTRASFAAAANNLGNSFDSTMLQQTQFTTRLHEGVTLGYTMAWNSSCSCIRYVGPPKAIPVVT